MGEDEHVTRVRVLSEVTVRHSAGEIMRMMQRDAIIKAAVVQVQRNGDVFGRKPHGEAMIPQS